MKLGVTAWNLSDMSAVSLTEQAKFAESLGYNSFWLPENHFSKVAIPDPLMMLASVAAGTSKIKLATTSYLLPLRHPLLAAEQVAVLDQLSQGRVILGIGRGYMPSMLKAFDIKPNTKRKIFEEALQTMRSAWRGQPLLLRDGETKVTLDPLPVQSPHPPIWVAAFGPKALAQAGRLGLPYLPSPLETISKLQDNFRIYSESIESKGKLADQVKPLMRIVHVTESPSELKAIREELNNFRIRRQGSGLDSQNDESWAIIGSSSEVKEKIAEYVEIFSTDYLVVSRLRVPGLPDSSVRKSLEQIVLAMAD